jgi:hypothetical protein
MARETCYVYDISKSREHQRVVDGANEFNMTKMTWTIILGQTTGCTTASNKTWIIQLTNHHHHEYYTTTKSKSMVHKNPNWK